MDSDSPSPQHDAPIHQMKDDMNMTPTRDPHIAYSESQLPAVDSRKGQGATVLTEKEIDDVGEGDERDIRKGQNFHGKLLFWLAYQSVGVVYGDIGTSPLYTYSGTFSSEPSYDDLLGSLSLIIWTLTLMVSIKYVFIVLHADDEGEGGTFAIYSLLSRYAHIVRRDPREERGIKMERVNTAEVRNGNRQARTFIENSRLLKAFLKVVGVLGVSLVMSDGVLTPAQSVLGAIQGLEVVSDNITRPIIVGTSCAILVLLFLIQPLGISKLGTAFAPIVCLWLIFNFAFGIYNLVHFDHTVLKAFSPYFAGAYFVRNKTDGWRSLGGILLAFTGVEALFADLGAFTRRAIQLSWLCFAFPCLLLAYIGQAAYMSQNKGAYSNPFFNSVPPGMLYPSLVVAILAAVVASQTMITASFQLLSQIVKLSYFPQIKVKHTSKIFHGQIYIPWVNWLLMIGTIAVTAAYTNTTSLGQAYGVCVILVTFLTTSMVSLVALIVWRLPIPIILAFFLVFGTLDGLYLSAALTKVPNGAWFTLCLAVVLSSIFVLWRYGKENQWAAEAEDHISPAQLLDDKGSASSSNASNLTNISENKGVATLRSTSAMKPATLSTIDGIGIFFDKAGLPNSTPTVFVHFVQKFQAMPTVAVFFNIRPLSSPFVPPEERFGVSRVFPRAPLTSSLRHMYRITVRHGYRDNILTSDLGSIIYLELRAFVIRDGARMSADDTDSSGEPSSGTPPDIEYAPSAKNPQAFTQSPAVHADLRALQSAYDAQVIHIVGKEQMRISTLTDTKYFPTMRAGAGLSGWTRKLILSLFLWLRSNTGSRVANMEFLDPGKVVEVGWVKMI